MAFKLKFKVPSYLKSVKYCLGAVNIVFMITGFMLLTVGILVLAAYSNYGELISGRFFNIPALAVAIGVLILLTSSLGFYSAISQNFYFIAAYVLLLLVVLVLDISLVIAAFALRNDAPSVIRSTMLTSLHLYSTRLDVAKIWDDLQTEFQCCGVAGRFDYNIVLPVSCCHIDYGTISPFHCWTGNAYEQGCASALGDWLAGKANALAIVALICTSIQALVTSLSGWLAWRSKFEEVELEH